ncbi:unnamed protein product [Cylindrotheca closterium]|uniref:Uncharacterized protein n=1 Tax=Cylindrotheca closterium TaxID=2856 RepID=A0AAD2CRX0_9STRA|nr:unnamed protein product [Cylindrotheca closterium]
MESRILATDTGQEGKAAIPEKPYFNMYFYQNTSSRPAPTSTSTSKASARPFLCINQNTIQGLRVQCGVFRMDRSEWIKSPSFVLAFGYWFGMSR